MQAHDFQLSVSILDATAGKSTLLIPALELGYFHNRCQYFGSRSAYLSWMVENYLDRLQDIKVLMNNFREPNWNTAYQSAGQDLRKMSFIPAGEAWEKMRQAAGVCGVSICFMFVILMKLEAEGFFQKSHKKPPIGRNSSPNKPEMTIKFRKFSIFTRKLDLRELVLHRKLH